MKLLTTFLNIATKVADTIPAPDKAPELTFEPQRFIEMLSYMGKGMLVIFVVIGVIILATMAINKIFSKQDK